MPLSIWSSLFLIPEQPLLVPFSLFRIHMWGSDTSPGSTLITKIHDILDNVLSKWVGNTACYLGSLFNYALRQHHGVWDSKYQFLHNFQASASSSKACLYGHTNWKLAQAQQQSFLGMSQAATSLWGGKTRLRVGFQFSVQQWPVAKSTLGILWQKSLTETLGQRVIRVVGSPLVVVHLPVSLTLRRRGTMGNSIPDVLQSATSLTSYSSVVYIGTLHHILYQWRSITSNRCVFNKVDGHHLQHRAKPSLFHNFHWFNIKATPAHHPVVQKEV